ncbi:8643_t:CDS:2, partial [Ambispora leptoticha]
MFDGDGLAKMLTGLGIGAGLFWTQLTVAATNNKELPEVGKVISLRATSGEESSNFGRYFFPADAQGEFFSYLNTEDYFSHCTDDKTFYQLLLIQWQTFLAKIKLNPTFHGEKASRTKKENPLLLLKSKCWQKLISLKKENVEDYQKILEKELKVIEKLNYADYFLVFSDVNNHLKKESIIVGPGRGSAVSSLITYLLGITNVDPLEHKLFFERFLNEKRKNLPDIDLDVENQEETAKLYKLGEIRLKEITSLTGENPNFKDLKLQRWQTSYPNLFQLTDKIQNLYYDTGIHPAGVIISESSLTGSVPLKSEKDYLLTLFEEDKLAELGLKKYDFLSLRETLGFIREAREILKVNLPDYQEVNLTDQKTWKLLENFLLTGIFQLDTPS